MKLTSYITVLCLFLTCAALTSCNEQEKATAAAARRKVDDSLTEQVGKAEVALEMLRKELQSKKEAWAKVKTMLMTYERRGREARAQEARAESQGKPERAAIYRGQAEKYEAAAARIKEREAMVEARFKQFQSEYEEKKINIQILKDEVATLKSMGDLSDSLDVSTKSEERMERARELEESLQRDCERANAIIEINMMDI